MTSYSQHLWHPFSHPTEVETLDPIHIVSADGVYIKDVHGHTMLDGNAGGLWCVTVGHGRTEVKEAIMKQLDEMAFFQIFNGVTHPRATELADRLVDMTQPENMKRVFFTSGGSDANETAIKLARQYHLLNGEAERKKIISLKGAYHGTHYGACTVSGIGTMHRSYEPVLPGTLKSEMPMLYRNPWNCSDPDQLVDFCINQLIADIEYEEAGTIAAIIAEPVSGANLVVPPANYWPRLREVCDKYGILLIADEVITGFGRTGSLFGCRGWGVAPDMMCLAKGLSSAYVPLGAVMINERMEKAWDANSDMTGALLTGVTYAGHPVGCAAALAVLDIVEGENLPENAKVQGEYLLKKLQPFADKFNSVGDVRGIGLMVALDLVVDKQTREPVDPKFATAIAAAARKEGLMIRPYGNKIMASPPLTYTTAHCDELVEKLERAFVEVDG